MKRLMLLLLGVICVLSFASCGSSEIETYSKTISTMNTFITINFYDEVEAETHYQAVRDIFNNVANVTDDFNESPYGNGVYELNQNRTLEADDILVDLIKESLTMMEETDGFFNPFIGRLSHIWKEVIESDNPCMPDESLIQNEVEIAKNTSVTIEGNTITLNGDGNLDLGGIAKGYATMKAVEYLKENDVDGYMISGSSNISLGTKAGKSFSVALDKPYNENDEYETGTIATLSLKNVNLGASSSKYQSTYVDGIKVHHIINPKTGYPETYHDGIFVICDDAMRADVYSTAIFSMDSNMGANFVEEKGIEALFYRSERITYYTTMFIA